MNKVNLTNKGLVIKEIKILIFKINSKIKLMIQSSIGSKGIILVEAISKIKELSIYNPN